MISIAKLMNARALFDKIVKEITLPESQEEIQSIAFLVMESLYGLDRTDVLANVNLETIKETDMSRLIARINQHEPIQYILEETDFYGRIFYVNDSVLIPRPETEQLIKLVVDEFKVKNELSILDIGTGSGCIAITLAKEIPQAQVFALDVSESALAVARRNADQLKATVFFDQLNALEDTLPYKDIDIIVSNPPYVMLSEKERMHANVLAYEPHLALFVPDTDALVFYKAIADHAKRILRSNGKIFVEINEQLGTGVEEVFKRAGFTQTEIILDIFSKDRIVTATR